MIKHSENTKTANCGNNVLANRLLKFRAWVKEQNRMIKVFGFNEHLVFEQTWDSPSIKENIFEIEDCSIMQFTVLLDKNGKEIFEGDILQTRHKSKIYYNNLIDYVLWDIQNSNAFTEVEIIGNIFENPELTQTTS